MGKRAMHAERAGLPGHRRLSCAAALAALAACGTFSVARAEPVVGQFELKTLDSAPGSFEFQSQNAWSWNEPRRRTASGPDGVEFDENAVVRSRYALELEMGFSRTFKMRVGVEFEKERLEDPETIDQADDFDSLRLTELGGEIIAVLAAREGDGAGFGLVAEVEGSVDREESSNLTLGPIFEYQAGRWFAAAVPMLVHAFGGDARQGEEIDDKWDFAYAAQLMYAFSERWSLALEGYGTVERLGDTGHPSEASRLFGDFNQHRMGPVLYYERDLGHARRQPPGLSGSGLLSDTNEEEGATLAIGLGLLEGLNGNTPDHTLKLSIEVDF